MLFSIAGHSTAKSHTPVETIRMVVPETTPSIVAASANQNTQELIAQPILDPEPTSAMGHDLQFLGGGIIFVLVAVTAIIHMVIRRNPYLRT